MLAVRLPRPPGPLGLLIPPCPPRRGVTSVGRNHGSTAHPTFGTTGWLTTLCGAAEAAGAAGLWATDHLFWRQPAPEALTTIAVAATATRRAVLGTCVLQLPLRSPAAVAKQAAALQHLTGGRFVLGVGVGSHAIEYELAGADFSTRGRGIDEALVAVRRAWATGDDPST